jgi:hypothetical protein
MKVGDLVIRKNPPESKPWLIEIAENQRKELGTGVILSKLMAGSPPHPCIDVFYGKVGKSWEIAESLMEVVQTS